MSTQQHKIEIDAYLKTHLNDLDKITGQLRKGLEEGATKVDLTKGMGKDLSKLITKFQAESSKLKGLIPDNMLNLSDSKNFQAAGASIISTFKQIQQTISDINTKSIVDVKKMFPDAFDSRVDQLSKRLESFATRAADIGKKNSELAKAKERLVNLENELSRINGMKPMDELQKEVDRTTDSLNKAAEAAKNLREQLANQLSQSPIDEKQFEEAEKQVADLSKSIDDLKNRAKKIDAGGVTKKGNSYAIGGKNIKEWEKEKKDGNSQAKEAIEVLQLYRKQNKELETQQQLLARGVLLKSAQQKKPEEWTKQEAEAVAASFQKTEQLAEANKNAETAAKAATEAQKNLNKAVEAGGKKTKVEIDISDTKQKIEELKTSISNLKSAGDLSGLKEAFNALGVEFAPQMLESAEGIQILQQKLNKIDATAFDALKIKLRELSGQFPQITQALNQFENGMGGARAETDKMFDTLKEVEQLKSRLTYFLGLTNTINLFKNTVRSAMNTVKELDAVMTETAVVTDFTIGDMWNRLPEYSSKATQLGASIKDLYSATTLYYQQGLKTEAAMGVGIETMKMARIANLEAGDATQYMTAALRGFNMEVSETNAIHVNDVYSELAAITAADTSQIATAMSKTASIANAANMEFETTAALLAQIIETTQEAPETAGTAMKTIIARFTEVKELFTEGMLSGEDEEGEIIDINKIDAALRTVGISLRDFLNGNKGIDDIFLELAKKWDTLDLATQRYIATTAAGSRQQSRFIAMMSNYGRTMELVSAANNSAGASQEQFGKTLKSLEAKTQKLQNAWAEFTMGLANNEILKFGVDVLTGLLTVVNKVIDALSGNSGIAKSLLTLTLAITALKGLKAIFAKIFGSELVKTAITSFDKIKNESKKTSKQLSKDMKNGIVEGLREGANQAGAEGYRAGTEYSKNFQAAVQGKPLIPSTVTGKKFTGKVANRQAAAEKKAGSQVPSENTEASWVSTFMKDTSTQSLYLVGTLTTLAGVVANFAHTTFFANDETNAFGKGLEVAGTTASIAGSAISLLAPVLSALGITVGSLIAPIGIAVVAFGALGWAMQAVHNKSPQGKLEQAQIAAEKAGEAANNAAENFNNLSNALDSLDGKYKGLEDLTRGTKEWNEAVRDLNSEVLDLIDKYPALAAFVKSEDGVLAFDKETRNTQGQTYDDVYASYEAAVGNSQAVKIMADVVVESAQQKVDYEDYRASEVAAGSQTRSDTGWLKEGTHNYTKENEDGTTTIDSWNTQEVTEKVARAMAKGEVGLEAESIIKFLREEFKFATDAAIVLGNALEKESLQLLEFGQSLALSDEKIEAYTSMLITQARNESGLEGQTADMAENFITGDMVEGIKQKLEDSINEDGISEIEKEDYATAMGYEFIEGNKFKNAIGEEIEVKDKEIASGLATAKALDEVAKKMEAFADSIPTLKDAKLANLYAKAEGQGLTKAEFNEYEINPNEKLSEDVLAIKAEEIFSKSKELQDLYGADNANDFISFFVESVTLGAEQYKQAVEKLTSENSNFWQGGENALFGGQENLDIGSMGIIVDQLYNVFLTSGKTASNELGKVINDTFDGLDSESAQKFADALGMIDWTNIDSIEKLNEYLVELGFDATALGIDVEGLEEQIKDFANATKKISLESLKAEIQSLDELAEDLSDREDTERVFSDEEKKALLKANPDMTDAFVMTSFDEWTYIGDSMTTLESAVREATKALWETYSEQTREAGEKSQAWQNLVENGQTWQSGKTDYDILQQLATGKLQESGLGEAGWTRVKDLMTSMGMFGEGADISKYSQQDLIEILASSYNAYGTVQARTENIAAYQNTQASDHATAYYSGLSGQEILDTENNKSFAGLTETQAAEARTEALKALSVVEEGLTAEIESSSRALGVNNDLMSASAVDAAADRKEMQKLADAINDNEDALNSANKGTAEYRKAIDKVTVEAKKAFGNNVTAEFVEENIEAFKAWAQGVEGSTERIRAALLEQIEAEDLAIYKLDGVAAAVAGLDGLKFDIYGNADFSEVMSSLKITEEEAAEFAALIERLGYSITWQRTGPAMTDRATGKTYYNYRTVVSNTANRARQTNAVNRSSGGGGGSNSEPYENSFDKLYNLVREIGEEIREMARIERKYEKLLKEEDVSAGDLYDNLVEQLNQLGRQQGLNERLRDERRIQIQDYIAENSDLTKYANVFQDEEGKDVLRINWDQIDLVQDPDKGQRIEDYVGQLEEWMDGLDDIEQELWDIEDQIEEIHDTGKEEYLDLGQAIKDALIEAQQKEIDELSQINDSINDTNTRLINSIQRQVNKIRQDRDNEKREEELADKQRQLLYLSQDTSGANALSILELQKEIDEGTQDYTDTLIDQKISELQEQNEDAAAQRDKQIQLMQAQLDHSIKTGQIWDQVYLIIDEGLDKETGLVRGSQLETLLKNKDGFMGMSQLQQMEWLKELEQQAALATVYLNDLKNVQPIVNQNTHIYYPGGTTAEPDYVPDQTGGNTGGGYTPPPVTPTETHFWRANFDNIYKNSSGQWVVTEGTRSTGSTVSESDAYNKAVALIESEYKQGKLNFAQKDKMIKSIKVTKVYKKGGLADFTGPAWLDGTKSRPEMVLNARDTQNFIQLKDILSSLLNGDSTTHNNSTENNGDITYDIDINVETMGSDYDVEQVANKVKSLINEEARYRNNNVVSLKR